MTPKNTKTWSDGLGVMVGILFLVLAMVILFVSFARASLQSVKEKIGSTGYRNVLLTLKPSIFTDENIDLRENYNLPNSGMLPNSPFYGFKKIRDELWLVFTVDMTSKSKLLALLADKKISEAVTLTRNNQMNFGMEAASEGVDRLEKAYKVSLDSKDKVEENKQVRTQLIRSGKAYWMIISQFGEENIEDVSISKSSLLDRLDTWVAKNGQEE